MNKNIIINFLKSGNTTSNSDMSQIDELIQLFPYCEMTRIMDLIFKKRSNDLLFEQKLSESIIHVNNRQFLFSLLNQKLDNSNGVDNQMSEKKITNKQSGEKPFNEWLNISIKTERASLKKRHQKPKIYNQNSDDLMTETLAKLYIEQKHFTQAIRAYEILSLKYPKKSSFFVREIEKIKQLILINDE